MGTANSRGTHGDTGTTTRNQRIAFADEVCGFQFPDWWNRWPTLRNEFIPALRMLAAVASGSDLPDHQWIVAERKQALRQLAALRRLLRHPCMRTVYSTAMRQARDTSNGYKHIAWKHHGSAWKYKTHEEQVAAYIINIASNSHRLPYTTEKDAREGRAPAGYLRLDRTKGDMRARASAKFMGLVASAAFGDHMARSVRTMLEVALPGHRIGRNVVREQCSRPHRGRERTER